MGEVSAGAHDVQEGAERAMLDALDHFAETAHPGIVPALQPAFAAQAEHARRAVADLVTIARRGRA